MSNKSYTYLYTGDTILTTSYYSYTGALGYYESNINMFPSKSPFIYYNKLSNNADGYYVLLNNKIYECKINKIDISIPFSEVESNSNIEPLSVDLPIQENCFIKDYSDYNTYYKITDIEIDYNIKKVNTKINYTVELPEPIGKTIISDDKLYNSKESLLTYLSASITDKLNKNTSDGTRYFIFVNNEFIEVNPIEQINTKYFRSTKVDTTKMLLNTSYTIFDIDPTIDPNTYKEDKYMIPGKYIYYFNKLTSDLDYRYSTTLNYKQDNYFTFGNRDFGTGYFVCKCDNIIKFNN